MRCADRTQFRVQRLDSFITLIVEWTLKTKHLSAYFVIVLYTGEFSSTGVCQHFVLLILDIRRRMKISTDFRTLLQYFTFIQNIQKRRLTSSHWATHRSGDWRFHIKAISKMRINHAGQVAVTAEETYYRLPDLQGTIVDTLRLRRSTKIDKTVYI